VGTFGMPASIVLGRMVPGTALGVLVGDTAYAWLAWQLAHREQRQDVCAMPLGIDTPSMFALCFGVVGPAFVVSHDATVAWSTGMAVLFLMGLGKIGAAFIGAALSRILPRTALLAAISAVAVALIMFLPFGKIIGEPVGGMVALGVILISLVGQARVLWRVPAVVTSVVAGLAAIWLARQFGYAPSEVSSYAVSWSTHWPLPSTMFVAGLDLAWRYLPLAIPVALATVVGGVDVTESAALAGDRYSTRSILLVEGIATLVAAVCGGVIQNTPYIGHPAYKRMGARAAYALAAGLFIGVGAMTGVIGVLIAVLPESVVLPIIVFVGLEMSAQAVLESEPRHVRAVALALVPVLAAMVNIELGGLIGAAGIDVAQLAPSWQHTLQTLHMMGNGFIVTAMLWSAWLIWVIDGRFAHSAAIGLAAALMTLFGVMHSPFADGHMFLPGTDTPQQVFALVAGYLFLAVLCLAVHGQRRRAQGPIEMGTMPSSTKAA
jgi:adenine/guanine/hypoxanthine permease